MNDSLDGIFDPLHKGRLPTMPECMTCNSVSTCERARMRVIVYKNMSKLSAAENEIQALHVKISDLKSSSGIQTTIKLGLSLMLTCSIFAVDMPDMRRPPNTPRLTRTRRE